MTKAPELERHCGSWIVIGRNSGQALLETFSRVAADHYAMAPELEVLTAAQWLARVNTEARLARLFPADTNTL